MDLDHHADFLRFVHDSLEDFNFFVARPRDWSRGDFARKLNSHAGHLPHLGASRLRGGGAGGCWQNQ